MALFFHSDDVDQLISFKEAVEITESALRVWVANAKADAGRASSDALTNAEREELQQLRRDVKRLQMERDILKKAASFFAKENG